MLSNTTSFSAVAFFFTLTPNQWPGQLGFFRGLWASAITHPMLHKSTGKLYLSGWSSRGWSRGFRWDFGPGRWATTSSWILPVSRQMLLFFLKKTKKTPNQVEVFSKTPQKETKTRFLEGWGYKWITCLIFFWPYQKISEWFQGKTMWNIVGGSLGVCHATSTEEVKELF